jgi:hypothetical protein
VQAAFWAGIACPLALSFFWPWWSHHFGVTVVLETLCFSLFLLAFNLSYEFNMKVDSAPWFAVLDSSLLLSTIILIWRTYVIYRKQREGVKKREASGPSS